MTPDPVPDKLTEEERTAMGVRRRQQDDTYVDFEAGFLAARDFYAARGSVSLPNEPGCKKLETEIVQLRQRLEAFALLSRAIQGRDPDTENPEYAQGYVLGYGAGQAEVEARVADLERALGGVRNAYGCFVGCTGALPGAPPDGSGHTPTCAAARAALVAAPSRPEGDEAVQAQVRGCEQEWIFYGGSYGWRRRKTEGYAGELLGTKFLGAEWGPQALVLKSRAEQAEARVAELERGLRGIVEYARTNEGMGGIITKGCAALAAASSRPGPYDGTDEMGLPRRGPGYLDNRVPSRDKNDTNRTK